MNLPIVIHRSLLLFRMCSIEQYNVNMTVNQLDQELDYNKMDIHGKLPENVAMSILENNQSYFENNSVGNVSTKEDMRNLFSSFFNTFKTNLQNSNSNNDTVTSVYESTYNTIFGTLLSNLGSVDTPDNWYYNSETNEFIPYTDSLSNENVSNGNVNDEDEFGVSIDDNTNPDDSIEIITKDKSVTLKKLFFEGSNKYEYGDQFKDDITFSYGGYHCNVENHPNVITAKDKFSVDDIVLNIINSDASSYDAEIETEINAMNDPSEINSQRPINNVRDDLRAKKFSHRSNKRRLNNELQNVAQLDEENRLFHKNYINKQDITKVEKTQRRFRTIYSFFNKHKTEKMMYFEKEDLGLNERYKKQKVIVCRPKEIIDKSSLNPDEGFYAVLEKGDIFSVKLDNRTVTFRRLDTIEEKYVVMFDNDSNLQLSKQKKGSYFDVLQHDDKYIFTDVTGNFTGNYVVGEDELVIDNTAFVIGSVGEGDVDNSNNTNVCLTSNTIIKTDQGCIPISKITEHTSIEGHRLLGYTKGFYDGPYIVKIQKDAFGKNHPNQDLFVTPEHSVYVNGRLIAAKRLADRGLVKGVLYEYYDPAKFGEVYNLLFPKWILMNANNILVESLHPKYNQYKNILTLF